MVKNFVNWGLHHRLKKAPGAYQTSQRGNRAFLWIGSPMNIDYAMHIDCDLENAGVSSPETTESSLEPFDGMLIRWFNRDPVGEGLREAICISATLSSSIPLKNTFVVHFLLQRINCKEMCNYFFLFCWNYAHALSKISKIVHQTVLTPRFYKLQKTTWIWMYIYEPFFITRAQCEVLKLIWCVALWAMVARGPQLPPPCQMSFFKTAESQLWLTHMH